MRNDQRDDYYIEKFIYLAKNLPEYGVQLH